MPMDTLKRDPTRTTMLRKQFIADVTRRFKALGRAITELVDENDAFGLRERPKIKFHAEIPGGKRQYQFLTDAKKVDAYQAWLKQQVDAKILSPVGGIAGKPWTAKYIDSAYMKGGLRAYTDTHAEALAGSSDFYAGGKAGFLKDVFGGPEALSKIELLGTRAFNGLKGITDTMSTQMSRILADGLAHGKGPGEIARELRASVSKMNKTRANMLARTEIINAHAEGQLDAFDALGIKELGVMAEWSTAGDNRVCEQCAGLEGSRFTVEEARGMIPIHPNCRCSWIPVEVEITKPKKKKKRVS